MAHYVSDTFFGIKDYGQFVEGLNLSFKALPSLEGLFAGDNLIAFDRNLSFLTDAPFWRAFNTHAKSKIEAALIWRMTTVLWGFRNGLKLEGDFVECACYKGITARIICDTVDFGAYPGRHYYLYDLFEHDQSMPHHHMPEHGNSLFEEVKGRFAHLPNVTVTQGRVPQSFGQAVPEKIAFLHLDLNSAEAEISALETLFDRMVPGAVMVLDDYGWLGYRAQKLAEDDWLGKRGYHVLELPTGQGLLIK
jgi:O-methyltransferase